MKFIFSLLCLSVCLSASCAEMRVWKNKDGREVHAEMVGIQGESVQLKLKGGKVALVPFSSLSKEDNDYIEENKDNVGESGEEKDTGIDMPDRWPTIVPGPKDFKLRLVPNRNKDQQKDGVTYKTQHFQFTADTELDDAAQEYVGRLYESAWSAIRAMPLEFGRVRKNAGRPLISKLAQDMDRYKSMGGMENSAGMFRGNGGKEDFTLIPYPSMGINKDGTLKDSGDLEKSRVLVHEITHHITFGSMGYKPWIVEGMADYVGLIPYDGNQFDFSGAFENVKKFGMRFVKDGVIQMPCTLEQFLEMSQSEFYQGGGSQFGVARNYTVGAMLVAYFVHLDGEDGVRALKNYMRSACRTPMDPSKSVLYINGVPVEEKRKKKEKSISKELLVKKKTLQELEDSIYQAWKEQGIELKFKSYVQ